MSIKKNIEWNLYKFKANQLLVWGLKNQCVTLYDDALIKKLRDIYYGEIPASILLLSNAMSNGHCYDMALLMARAFLEDDGDVNLIYASVDNIRLNPKFSNSCDPSYSDHCIVERVTKDGKHLIYDTSSGFVYDKELYWKMEHPIVRQVRNKDSIVEYVKSTEECHSEKAKEYKSILSLLILTSIENSYHSELYARPGIMLLQREVEYFKKKIMCEEIDDDMKKIELRK